MMKLDVCDPAGRVLGRVWQDGDDWRAEMGPGASIAREFFPDRAWAEEEIRARAKRVRRMQAGLARAGGRGRRRAIDSQRNRLYEAEREAFAGEVLHEGRDLAAIERWVHRILASDWCRTHHPAHHARRLGFAGGVRGGVAYRTYIKLGPWGRARDSVILHELAHVLAYGSKPSTEGGHGRTFARIYLGLVDHWLGREAGRALRARFKAHRVKWRPTRRLTPAQRARAAEILSTVRAAARPAPGSEL